ncbi:unnamed protein product [Darwinula stevensoni]|uniref:OTU domain-containing protein 3 n=1 Tax=Darwinula stevensoni TaxID=69355 RepID=A0A7R8XD85_9CRUS|nr:unnamed protein product [Darwinula stevensoni]CAG0894070.1 unnamed protein product [Darwinula stevensoni]
MARKREEKAAKASYQKEQKVKKSLTGSKFDDSFVSVNKQLSPLGLMLREIPGDGNCLFRALGDQLDGHTMNHLTHRRETAEYMKEHRPDFEPFVEDDITFDKHVESLGEPGTYAGNDAIVAFARRHNVIVVIHQLNAPLWKVHGGKKGAKEIHIAYHNGDHYNSVRRIGDHSDSPANVRIGSPTPENDGNDEVNLSGLSEMEKYVMEHTNCMDPINVRQALEDNEYDVEATVDFLNVLYRCRKSFGNVNERGGGSLWGEEGSGRRIFGDEIADDVAGNQGARPKDSSLSAAGNGISKYHQPRVNPIVLFVIHPMGKWVNPDESEVKKTKMPPLSCSSESEPHVTKHIESLSI